MEGEWPLRVERWRHVTAGGGQAAEKVKAEKAGRESRVARRSTQVGDATCATPRARRHVRPLPEPESPCAGRPTRVPRGLSAVKPACAPGILARTRTHALPLSLPLPPSPSLSPSLSFSPSLTPSHVVPPSVPCRHLPPALGPLARPTTLASLSRVAAGRAHARDACAPPPRRGGNWQLGNPSHVSSSPAAPLPPVRLLPSLRLPRDADRVAL